MTGKPPTIDIRYRKKDFRSRVKKDCGAVPASSCQESVPQAFESQMKYQAIPFRYSHLAILLDLYVAFISLLESSSRFFEQLLTKYPSFQHRMQGFHDSSHLLPHRILLLLYFGSCARPTFFVDI
jgi:hypothetical protein